MDLQAFSMRVWFFFHNFKIEDYQYPKGSEWQRGLLEATFRFSSTQYNRHCI